MSAIKITKLPLATLAGAVLLILACLLLSFTQARAETKKDQAIATSLAEVTLEPEAKLLVTLGTGEKIKGKATNIGDGTLSVSTKYGIRTLSESKIVQIFQVKGTSRARGALYGALIGAAGTLAIDVVDTEGDPFAEFVLIAPLSIPSGAAIGALVVSGEEKKLVFQNPTIAHNGRQIATSLAELTLEPGTKLLVTLGTGEKIKGKATDISDGALSVSKDYGIRRLHESEIYQVIQVKGRSRGRGALYGGMIVTAGALGAACFSNRHQAAVFTYIAAVFIPPVAVIGALISGEKHELVYQNPTNSTGIRGPAGANLLLKLTHRDYSPHDFKIGLINLRDGQLNLGVPSIYLRPNRFDGFRVRPSKKRTKHIELVRVDF